MTKDARGFGRRVLESLADPSGELSALRDENAELRANLERVRAELAANEHHEDGRLSIAEATIERLTGPEARERLARHLYVEGCALEAEAAARWDAGKVPPGQMGNYRRAANRAVAALDRKEN